MGLGSGWKGGREAREREREKGGQAGLQLVLQERAHNLTTHLVLDEASLSHSLFRGLPVSILDHPLSSRGAGFRVQRRGSRVYGLVFRAGSQTVHRAGPGRGAGRGVPGYAAHGARLTEPSRRVDLTDSDPFLKCEMVRALSGKH